MIDPWMKFYPQDWRADEKLRMCSLAARGLWLEMLAIMHRSERYGHLLVNGHVPTDAQLAILVGAPPSEVTALLADLDGAGVFSRSANGAIYSRRMTRDHKKAKKARENGKKGGNPSLGKGKGNPAWDNPRLNGRVKTQIPEARSQIPEEEEPDGSSNPIVPSSKSDGFDAFWKAYPRRVGKEAARKAWAVCLKRGVKSWHIIEGAQWLAAHPPDDPKYIPHPATWLNQGRYDDERTEDGERPVAGNRSAPAGSYRRSIGLEMLRDAASDGGFGWHRATEADGSA